MIDRNSLRVPQSRAQWFTEFGELAVLLQLWLDEPNLAVRHWPTFYRLFLLISDLASLLRCFELSGRSEESRINSPDSRAYDELQFARLKRLYIDIVRLLDYARRYDMLGIEDSAAGSIIRACFSPKKEWLEELAHHYTPGRFVNDRGIEYCYVPLPLARMSSVQIRYETEPVVRRSQLDEITCTMIEADAREKSGLFDPILQRLEAWMLTKRPSIEAFLNPHGL